MNPSIKVNSAKIIHKPSAPNSRPLKKIQAAFMDECFKKAVNYGIKFSRFSSYIILLSSCKHLHDSWNL